jgi:hypothetical protein
MKVDMLSRERLETVMVNAGRCGRSQENLAPEAARLQNPRILESVAATSFYRYHASMDDEREGCINLMTRDFASRSLRTCGWRF